MGVIILQTGLSERYGVEKALQLTEVIPSLDSPLLPFEVFVIYTLVQWWVKYDADGSGYIAQRIYTAKNAREAQKGTLLFALTFIALRTWPWVLVALVALVLFPLDNPMKVYPQEGAIVAADREAAYPLLMRLLLPTGVMGLAFTSLMAAFMSTVDTHLNWGASYLTNDIYRRFIQPNAHQRQLVMFGRISVVCIAFLAVVVASQMETIASAWKFFINAAAGLGVAQLMRWFWWRANAWTEIAAMLAALFATLVGTALKDGFTHIHYFDTYLLPFIVLLCILVAVTVTYLTPPTSEEQLTLFIDKCQPIGLWRGSGLSKVNVRRFRRSVLLWLLGLTLSFCGLFAIGYFLLLRPQWGIFNALLAVGAWMCLNRLLVSEEEL